MKDKELVERLERGDNAALDYLYTKNYGTIRRMVLRNSGSEDEARDVFQDALIVVYRKAVRKELVLTSKLSTFLYSICKNLWRKELEKKAKKSGTEAERVEEPDYDAQERIKIIRQCIDDLGENCRDILMLYYFDKCSMKEIAEKLNLANADTAKTKKYKCKIELEKLVKSRYNKAELWD